MRLLSILVLGLVLSGCAQTPHLQADRSTKFLIDDLATHHGAVHPWTSLEADADPSKFQFLVVADRTSGPREGVFEEGLQKAALLKPEFVMSVGDYVEGYVKDESILREQWSDIARAVDQLDSPFFYVPGNHDWAHGITKELWEERLGRSYYHFVYKQTLFLVLNSELFDLSDAPWHNSPWRQKSEAEQRQQLAYIERTLSRHEDVRWTFVFIHQPLWQGPWKKPPVGTEISSKGPWPKHSYVPPEWRRVEELLARRDFMIFAGHLHAYDYVNNSLDGRQQTKITLATTGGISAMRGADYGEFDHLVWVTMSEEGPVIANVLLEGILPAEIPMPKRRPYWVN